MANGHKKAWVGTARPALRQPQLQVGAICVRGSGHDREVLLITSRDTGRWIVPKGWPIEGKTAAASALQEAWEEAGVKKATLRANPIGCYEYDKRLDKGDSVPIEVQVFLLDVGKLSDSFPEAGERTRRWVSPAEAADMVAEPGLRDILRAL